VAQSETNVLERLKAGLTQAGIDFRQMRHRPVHTSAEAAAVRRTALHSGAKALIVKGDGVFVMAVMPADLSLHGVAFRRLLRFKRLRFATKEEVLQITGLTPGSIPPFGSLFDLPTICDERLADNERINFSAGTHSDSIQMAYTDYIAYESPRIARVGKPSGTSETS
jgi:Ala-tRNA(Pro) deacylase